MRIPGERCAGAAGIFCAALLVACLGLTVRRRRVRAAGIFCAALLVACLGLTVRRRRVRAAGIFCAALLVASCGADSSHSVAVDVLECAKQAGESAVVVDDQDVVDISTGRFRIDVDGVVSEAMPIFDLCVSGESLDAGERERECAESFLRMTLQGRNMQYTEWYDQDLEAGLGVDALTTRVIASDAKAANTLYQCLT